MNSVREQDSERNALENEVFKDTEGLQSMRL